MSSKKPQPLFDRKVRVRCPVCGEISYSAVGIHPQCAFRQADKERMIGVRARIASGLQTAASPLTDMSPWTRACPLCKRTQHARNKACQCGQVFNAVTPVRSE